MKHLGSTTSGAGNGPSKRRRRGATRVLIGLGAVLAVVAAWLWLPIFDWLEIALQGIRDLGPVGMLVFVGIFAIAAIFAVPGSILAMSAGFLFGFGFGSITANLGSLAGACTAFLLGRTVGRRFIEARLHRSPRFLALDHAVHAQGFKIVFLARAAPFFPYNMLNYMFGISRVRIGHYVLGSWLGLIPGSLMYAYAGSIASNLADVLAGKSALGHGELTALAAGLVITVALGALIAQITRRALATALVTDLQPITGVSVPVHLDDDPDDHR